MDPTTGTRALTVACCAFVTVPNLGALLGRGEQTDRYDTVVTPPSYAFAIWGPIFATCAGDALRRWRDPSTHVPSDAATATPLAAAYAPQHGVVDRGAGRPVRAHPGPAPGRDCVRRRRAPQAPVAGRSPPVHRRGRWCAARLDRPRECGQRVGRRRTAGRAGGRASRHSFGAGRGRGRRGRRGRHDRRQPARSRPRRGGGRLGAPDHGDRPVPAAVVTDRRSRVRCRGRRRPRDSSLPLTPPQRVGRPIRPRAYGRSTSRTVSTRGPMKGSPRA